jgi:hypothetical protein
MKFGHFMGELTSAYEAYFVNLMGMDNHQSGYDYGYAFAYLVGILDDSRTAFKR